MISVVIAAYNAEKYIAECIESVINQTYKDLEIIIVDDGSGDNTWNIIRKYAVSDSRIVPIHQENQGPSAARNTAFDQMTGEYVTVIDSDDWVDADCYERAYQAAIDTDADMVIWGLQRFDENKVMPQADFRLKKGLYEGDECTALWKDFIYRQGTRVYPFVPCRLIRTSLLNDNGLRMDTRLKRSEDYMLLCQAHFYCKKVFSMADHMFLHYRQNADSITHGYVEDYFKMVMIMHEELIAFSKKNQAFSSDVQERIDRMYLYRIFMVIENEKRHEVDRKKKTEIVQGIINNSTVVTAAKRIGFSDGKKLYGKKYYALRLGLGSILLKYCKG